MTLPRLSAILLLALAQMFSACKNDSEKHEGAANEQRADSLEQPSSPEAADQHWQGPLEQFFHSKGVLEYKYPERSYQILNEDNTVYATINFRTEQIKFRNREFWLKDFLQDSALRNRYQFFPKDVWYPDYSVINFEYTDVKDGIAEVFLNKEKDVRKRIRLSDSAFRVEPWKDHFMGSMVDFNKKENLIRVSPDDNAKSVGYENYTGKPFIHIISEISGDWVRVECGANRCGYPCSAGKKYDGWIRWKKGDKMLIDLPANC